ncbi:hypothetical protein TNCV_1655981 [Trichonephila clavipes]|nr:hypothetical protein TNCV_1655981 [Trichonephila clavipes]
MASPQEQMQVLCMIDFLNRDRKGPCRKNTKTLPEAAQWSFELIRRRRGVKISLWPLKTGAPYSVSFRGAPDEGSRVFKAYYILQ